MVLHFDARTVQSISASFPYFSDNHSFAFLKWPFPKKPLWAERGEGCADLNMSEIRTRGEQADEKKNHLRSKCLPCEK
jgi:hypothetical protein